MIAALIRWSVANRFLVVLATLFLAADDSDGMTGQHVLVDAGIAQQSVIV